MKKTKHQVGAEFDAWRAAIRKAECNADRLLRREFKDVDGEPTPLGAALVIALSAMHGDLAQREHMEAALVVLAREVHRLSLENALQLAALDKYKRAHAPPA